MIKKTTLVLSIFSLCLVMACRHNNQEELMPKEEISAEVVYPKDQRQIRTPDGANDLDLETPLRCNVNWKTQQMVLTILLSELKDWIKTTDCLSLKLPVLHLKQCLQNKHCIV